MNREECAELINNARATELMAAAFGLLINAGKIPDAISRYRGALRRKPDCAPEIARRLAEFVLSEKSKGAAPDGKTLAMLAQEVAAGLGEPVLGEFKRMTATATVEAKKMKIGGNKGLEGPDKGSETAALPQGAGIDKRTPQPIEEPRFLHNPARAEEVAEDFLASVESFMFSRKKLGIAINKKLRGFDRDRFFASLRRWKEVMRRKNPETMGRLLDNVVPIAFDSEKDLAEQLRAEGIDAADEKNNLVFTFSPKPESGNPMKIGAAIHPVYIDDHEMEEGCYYPMVEVITISLASELMRYSIDKICEVLQDINDIELRMLNIEEMGEVNDPAVGRYLIFRLVPNAERKNTKEHVDRYKRLLKFIESA